MIKYPHQLMPRLHLFEWLGCSFMFVNKRTILTENCVRVHVRWTKKSGNKVNSKDVAPISNSSRFTTVSCQGIQNIITNSKAKSTRKNTNWAMNTFRGRPRSSTTLRNSCLTLQYRFCERCSELKQLSD